MLGDAGDHLEGVGGKGVGVRRLSLKVKEQKPSYGRSRIPPYGVMLLGDAQASCIGTYADYLSEGRVERGGGKIGRPDYVTVTRIFVCGDILAPHEWVF